MEVIKKALKNLQSNLWFLLSFLGILALSYSAEAGLRKLILLIFVACSFGCLFIHCPLPLKKDVFNSKKAALLAVAFEFTLLLVFYKNFTPSILLNIAQALHIPSQWLIIAIGVVFCVVGFYAFYLLSLSALRALHPFKSIATGYWKQLLVLSIVFCISIVAIIRANYNYVDDMARVRQGYQLTGSFSRYIASFMATFIHSNSYLADISPFPQLLAACILAFTAVTLYTVFADTHKMSIWSLIALIPLGTFPLFLQCYSYKYDAPYMAFSIFAAIAPLVYREKRFIHFFLAVFIGTILVCTTYQASSGIFPLATAAVCFGMWLRNDSNKNMLKFLGSAISGYVFGMVIFRFLLMDSSNGGYVNTSISLDSIIPNIKEYFMLLGNWFSPIWVLLVLIIACSLVIANLQTMRHKLVTLLLSLCTIVLMCVLSFGAYILFNEPLFYPRGMYGIGIVITIWCVQVSVSNKQILGRAATALLSFCFFIFSFTYGNALHMQNEYTHFRLEQVLSDISDLNLYNDGHKVSVQVIGTISHPDYLENTFEEWSLLDELVTVQFSDSSWFWGDYELLYYYGMDDILVSSDGVDLTQYELPVLIDCTYHTIRGDGNSLVIELK